MRFSTSSISRSTSRCSSRRAQRDARGGGADRISIGLVLADRQVERLLLEHVVDAVVGSARVEQVGRERRVERRLDPVRGELARLGLEVVRASVERCQQAAEPLGLDRRERDTSACRDGVAPVARTRDADLLDAGQERGEARLVQLHDADRDGLRLLRGRRHGLVELVDAPEQRAELEAAEDLLEPRTVGRVDDQAGHVDVELEVALDGRAARAI